MQAELDSTIISDFVENTAIKIPPNAMHEDILLNRKSYDSSNEQIKGKLQSYKNDYPEDEFVQYHSVMAIEAHLINELFDKFRQNVGVYIVEDIFLTDKEKYQIFLKIFNSDLKELAAYALSASYPIRKFIANNMVDASFKNAEEAAYTFRKAYVLSGEQPQPQLELLQGVYSIYALVSYHCKMVLAPHTLTSFDTGYIFDDSLLTEEEKYLFLLDKIFKSNLQELIPFSVRKKWGDQILRQIIIHKYSNDVAEAAFDFRKLFDHNRYDYSRRVLFEFLKKEYPENSYVEYQATMAGLSAMRSDESNAKLSRFFNKWPEDMGEYILHDTRLTRHEKFDVLVKFEQELKSHSPEWVYTEIQEFIKEYKIETKKDIQFRRIASVVSGQSLQDDEFFQSAHLNILETIVESPPKNTYQFFKSVEKNQDEPNQEYESDEDCKLINDFTDSSDEDFKQLNDCIKDEGYELEDDSNEFENLQPRW